MRYLEIFIFLGYAPLQPEYQWLVTYLFYLSHCESVA